MCLLVDLDIKKFCFYVEIDFCNYGLGVCEFMVVCLICL